ncbi:uncharacterized protein C8R40DRAFT_508385 [Lentinula edodes]|uniref:uncharacterized protein n=1 Tax=Lentinula edodes TaxID=5353 RepID=UPI001E8D4F97|nr:uncharacterized protein C8R40DRAFT_508385 [Lentinula edodes]KAH7872171.1 hypothetical protein C8R40DRAFT_508385 [Lentinula edodes]
MRMEEDKHQTTGTTFSYAAFLSHLFVMIIFLFSFLRISPVAASYSFNTSLNCQRVDKKHSLYRIAYRSAPECSSSDKRVTPLPYGPYTYIQPNRSRKFRNLNALLHLYLHPILHEGLTDDSTPILVVQAFTNIHYIACFGLVCTRNMYLAWHEREIRD